MISHDNSRGSMDIINASGNHSIVPGRHTQARFGNSQLNLVIKKS